MRKIILLTTLFLSAISVCKGVTITGLTASFKHGQVFLKWKNTGDSSAYYNVYRSADPITKGSMLGACEFLGKTNPQSCKDFNLSRHDGINIYFRLDSLAPRLDSTKALFVATTLVTGNYYYAVTVLLSTEDTAIHFGINSLNASVHEIVMTPAPIYQETRYDEDLLPFDIYTTFYSSKTAVGGPLMNSAGFIASDFALFRHTAPGIHPLNVKFHSGGVDFFSNATGVSGDEINISLEDNLPDDETTSWWGANEHFDIYSESKNDTPPNSGIDYDYTLQRITAAIDWAISHLPVDTNRIYLEGTSFGAPGAYFYTMTFPDRIAATKLSVGIFNFSFQADYQPTCSMNTGKKNRKEGNQRFGTIASNFMTNLNYHIYDMLNGTWMIHNYNDKSYPVIYSVNGKRDDIMGWTEKPIYYDSINANHIGGYYFWDNRDHAGNGKTWDGSNFNLLRYRKNLSFPAFANCSLNEDYGTGNGAIGLEFGSVNGCLDWYNNIKETPLFWESKIFVRNLITSSEEIIVYADSCTVDITPRRTQQFKLTIGDSVTFTVTHNNQIIQSGSKIYNGGLLVITGVKVFRDTSVLHITRYDSSVKNSSLSSETGFNSLDDLGSTITFSPNMGQCLLNEDNPPMLFKPNEFNRLSNNSNLIDGSLTIYPNPNNGHFFITTHQPEGSKGLLEIYNYVGQKINSDPFIFEGSEVTREFTLPAGSSEGIYLVRLTIGSQTQFVKFNLF